ncbi:MAG: arginine decarboxylase, pyruvoyl-dependent [Pseudomonadota bacterium]
MFGPPPTRYFLAAGAADASNELNAFDAALLAAGVGNTNLVRMSSILPPGCRLVEPYQLIKGSLVPLAYGSLTSREPGRMVSAAVAVGIPEDPAEPGLIMEYSVEGDPETCEQTARDMVREGMEEFRGLRIKEIKSISASHTVMRVGAAFSAVILCP